MGSALAVFVAAAAAFVAGAVVALAGVSEVVAAEFYCF